MFLPLTITIFATHFIGMSKFLVAILSTLLVLPLYADEYEEYVSKYKSIAIREMYDYGIPASITLAQGILESGLGKSELAVNANNHFGIKCHNEWSGERMYHDDDARQECFRKYDNAEESFIDHSQFLKNRARYSFLFELDRSDYKGWAKGLKEAGYATDPKYPVRLINLIEEHNLHQYDLMTPDVVSVKVKVQKDSVLNIKHIYAKEGDTYYTLSKLYHIPFGLIYVYNDVSRGDRQPQAGDVVFLQSKRNKCDECPVYTVKSGDSMHSISQKLGVKLLKLYDLNDMPYTAVPVVGQELKLN